MSSRINLSCIFTSDNDLYSHSYLLYFYSISNKSVNLLDVFLYRKNNVYHEKIIAGYDDHPVY